jgi:hypothetical protein
MNDVVSSEDAIEKFNQNNEKNEVITVEGGEITNLGDENPVTFHKDKHRADTTRKLAFVLLGILAFFIFLHYICIIFLEFYDKHEAVERLGQTYNNWLPVLTTLAGSAVTYYFTTEKS